MTFICFFRGCAWMRETPIRLGNEDVAQQRCSRCGSNRYVRATVTPGPGR
ncbi:PSPA7_2676 family Cys-rich small protein [Pseudomonas sp. JS3066]|nr:MULTISPECIES: PSPA7_2676 family Cys-rich small protein [unclassified Pseudomonas]WVK95786.1 PSPA7_2676 family Cys-rich small protein [Pseudomonas sp. JS3066]